jgi:hypothetical protein
MRIQEVATMAAMCAPTKPWQLLVMASTRFVRVETYNAHRAVQREASNSEDFADGDDNVAEEEELHFPGVVSDLLSCAESNTTHLRPTAAFFLSDLHSKNALVRMAMAQSIIEPSLVSAIVETW